MFFVYFSIYNIVEFPFCTKTLSVCFLFCSPPVSTALIRSGLSGWHLTVLSQFLRLLTTNQISFDQLTLCQFRRLTRLDWACSSPSSRILLTGSQCHCSSLSSNCLISSAEPWSRTSHHAASPQQSTSMDGSTSLPNPIIVPPSGKHSKREGGSSQCWASLLPRGSKVSLHLTSLLSLDSQRVWPIWRNGSQLIRGHGGRF